jgi:hypothetical protein
VDRDEVVTRRKNDITQKEKQTGTKHTRGFLTRKNAMGKKEQEATVAAAINVMKLNQETCVLEWEKTFSGKLERHRIRLQLPLVSSQQPERMSSVSRAGSTGGLKDPRSTELRSGSAPPPGSIRKRGPAKTTGMQNSNIKRTKTQVRQNQQVLSCLQELSRSHQQHCKEGGTLDCEDKTSKGHKTPPPQQKKKEVSVKH